MTDDYAKHLIRTKPAHETWPERLQSIAEAEARRAAQMTPDEWTAASEGAYISPRGNEAPMAIDVPYYADLRDGGNLPPEPYNARIIILGVVLMLMAVTAVIWASGYFWGIM